MFEGYFCGILFLTAARLWSKKSPTAPKFMIAAWTYTNGGKVPFLFIGKKTPYSPIFTFK